MIEGNVKEGYGIGNNLKTEGSVDDVTAAGGGMNSLL
jgi:hypothetical protein